MKKIITTIVISILFMAIAVPAFAQLNVKSEQIKVEKIGSLRSTYAYLYAEGTSYFLKIRSSNQFDDPCLFFLGEDAESSILTLNDLCNLCDTMESKAAINVEDAKGQKAILIKKTMLGAPYLDIVMEGQAGSSNITTPELKKAIELIQIRENKQEN